jgi:outer membrane protein assembly factor BamB
MAAQANTASRRLALLIATSEYSDPALRQLRAPGRDANELAEVLGTPQIGDFTVQKLINARCGELMEAIEEFCADRRLDDQLLIYLSCHGVLDDRGRLYYAATDTRRQREAATAVAAGWLNERLEDCRARSQIVILDCCHSGAFAAGAKGPPELALEQRFKPHGRGRIVLTASRGTEYSFEGDQASGDGVQSVFTQAIVDGLRTGDADRDKDGLISVTDIYHHVYDRVRSAEPRQTPELWTYGAEGDVLLAYSIRGAVIELVPLPEDLRVTLESPRPRIRETAVAELAELLDTARPGLALSAQRALQQIREEDIPRVATVAAVALDASHGEAARAVGTELNERDQRDRERQQSQTAIRRQIDEHANDDPAAAETPSESDDDLIGTPLREPGSIEGTLPAVDPRPARLAVPRRKVIVAVAAAIAFVGGLAGFIIAAYTPRASGTPSPPVRWAYSTGRPVHSGPAVAGGTVYVGSNNDMVYALNAANGHLRWAYNTGYFVSSSPAVAGSSVYVNGGDNKVYALNAANGHLRWTYTTAGPTGSSRPAVSGGTVYVGSWDGKVYALDTATGNLRWVYTAGSYVDSSPMVTGGTVYIGSGDDKVYALNAANGRLRWTYTTGNDVESSPAVAGGTVYIGSNDNKVYALNAANGHLRWTYTTANYVESSPAVAGGTVYIGSGDDDMYALNAANGHLRWAYNTGGPLGSSSPVVVAGTVYVGSWDGKVYALNGATGHLRWVYTTGNAVYSSPAVAGGIVYVGSGDGKVYALDAADTRR